VEALVESGGAGGEADFLEAFEPFWADLFGALDVVGGAAELAGGAGELGGVV